MSLASLTLTGEQIRAARALARLSQADLARISCLSLETIKRLEHIRGPVEANSRTLSAIAQAFIDLGVYFHSGDEVGVRTAGVERPASRSSSAPPAPSVTPRGGPMAPIHRLIYFSIFDSAAGADVRQTLDDIREVSSVQNRELGITGALLACNGRFLQALEGDKAAVYQVYGAISADSRHRDLNIVESRAVTSRQFLGWDLCCGLFSSDRELFRREPVMADGLNPEALTAVTALGLLTIMCDLQQQPPRNSRGTVRACSLASQCLDTICAAAAK